ncbi:hypothetical protein IRJ41_021497, partial [Triplophysa rosa]
ILQYLREDRTPCYLLIDAKCVAQNTIVPTVNRLLTIYTSYKIMYGKCSSTR